MRFVVISIGLVCLSYLLLFIFNRKLVSPKKPQELAIDSVTLSSGLILFLYIFGIVTNIEYLRNIDEFTLFIALFIGGITLISSVTDKYRENNKKKKSLKE